MNPSDWLQVFELRLKLHQHEDVLFNSRLTAFVLANSFLLAAVSQFRERQFALMAALICFLSILFACTMLDVLSRTAKGLAGLSEKIVEAEGAAFSELERQVYAEFRARPEARRSVSRMLGVWVPWGVLGLWSGLLVLLVMKHLGDYWSVWSCMPWWRP